MVIHTLKKRHKKTRIDSGLTTPNLALLVGPSLEGRKAQPMGTRPVALRRNFNTIPFRDGNNCHYLQEATKLIQELKK